MSNQEEEEKGPSPSNIPSKPKIFGLNKVHMGTNMQNIVNVDKFLKEALEKKDTTAIFRFCVVMTNCEYLDGSTLPFIKNDLAKMIAFLLTQTLHGEVFIFSNLTKEECKLLRDTVNPLIKKIR